MELKHLLFFKAASSDPIPLTHVMSQKLMNCVSDPVVTPLGWIEPDE